MIDQADIDLARLIVESAIADGETPGAAIVALSEASPSRATEAEVLARGDVAAHVD